MGTVINNIFWNFVAPSRSAASYMSFEIFCKPAKNIIIETPIHDMLIIIKPNIDVFGFCNQLIESIPNKERR